MIPRNHLNFCQRQLYFTLRSSLSGALWGAILSEVLREVLIADILLL